MNADLLSCKREVVSLIQSNQPPLDGNGKRKGYMKIMKEVWEAKGYVEPGLSSQNLRDQAARIEISSQPPEKESDSIDANITREQVTSTEPEYGYVYKLSSISTRRIRKRIFTIC